MKIVNEFLSSIYDGIANLGNTLGDYTGLNFLMMKPIGLLSKEYGLAREMLARNIGNGFHVYDGYGTPIGTVSDPNYNAYRRPGWFMTDDKKRMTSNYLDYISLAYNEEGIINNFLDGEYKIATHDTNSLVNNIGDIGVIRHYELSDNVNSNIRDDGRTNPNYGITDTRLGLINGYYLDSTLHASRMISEDRKYKNDSITIGAYDSFGLGNGDNSIKNGFNEISGRVRTSEELIGNVIPWSTTDHSYDTNIVGNGRNIDKVIDILTNYGDVDGILGTKFNDEAQNTSRSPNYYPFGNFYSITYSLGLTSVSGSKTHNFIAKSMFGYDLMSNDEINFDYENGNPSEHYLKTGKRYYVSNGTRGTNYIDIMTGNDVEFVKYIDGKENANIVRIKLNDAGNDSLWSTRTLYTYGEAEGNSIGTPSDELKTVGSYNSGIEYGKHIVYDETVTSTKRDIVNYTNKLFLRGKLDTLVSRFHGNEYESKTEARANRDITQSAISKYGVSHGRNLLKKNHLGSKDHNYSNPYCRVWTYHHQYGTFNETIRPFKVEGEGGLENTDLKFYRTSDGLDRLSKHGAKTDMGLVRIAPSEKDNIRRCMFSIENLAWKGELNFFKNHEDQRGPLGGRIMWFPPYDLRFSEGTNVNWNPNSFINRGENIYTYVNSERTGQLSFKLLIDHPVIVNSYRSTDGGEIGGDGIGDVDDVNSFEQSLLRFFAGCDILEAKKPKTKIKEDNVEKSVVPEIKTRTIQVPKTTYDEINFFVFYPNNYSGEDDEGDVAMNYLINGICSNLYCNNGKIEDYFTTLDKRYRGYEMGNEGISVSGKYGTTKCGDNKVIGTYDGITYVPQKHMGKNGKYRYWAYRVDKRVANEVLYPVNNDWDYNYFDTKSYKLNSTDYALLLQAHTDMQQVYDEGKLYSFTDVFCAVEGKKAEKLLGNLCNTENSLKIRKMIEEYDVIGIDVNGFASSHGYTSSNEKLNRNRGKSVVSWLQKRNPSKFSMDMFNFSMNQIGDKLGHHDSMDFSAKVWRCAKVCIKLQKEDIIEKAINTDTNIEKPVFEGQKKIDNVNHYDNVTDRSSQEAKDIAKAYNATNQQSFVDIYKSLNNGKIPSKVQQRSVLNTVENNKANAEVESMSARTNGDTTFLVTGETNCYSNEYKFFTDLKREDSLLHSKIVDKIKYFDPAFHSITPEGFNARCTFLNQCTRQGRTNASSDLNGSENTANNLAFGRPPVCVLRIGDFYNTKIIIDSLQIRYDDTTWDLNDEGIGIMPMMADVSISFKFLGGSDLSGPITRLQNALSFNYYGNTSVYDERAEKVEYNYDNGEMISFMPQY